MHDCCPKRKHLLFWQLRCRLWHLLLIQHCLWGLHHPYGCLRFLLSAEFPTVHLHWHFPSGYFPFSLSAEFLTVHLHWHFPSGYFPFSLSAEFLTVHLHWHLRKQYLRQLCWHQVSAYLYFGFHLQRYCQSLHYLCSGFSESYLHCPWIPYWKIPHCLCWLLCLPVRCLWVQNLWIIHFHWSSHMRFLWIRLHKKYFLQHPQLLLCGRSHLWFRFLLKVSLPSVFQSHHIWWFLHLCSEEQEGRKRFWLFSGHLLHEQFRSSGWWSQWSLLRPQLCPEWGLCHLQDQHRFLLYLLSGWTDYHQNQWCCYLS